MTTPASRHIKSLVDIGPDQVARFGSKAVNCAQLLRAGFSVPDGLAISVDASDRDLDTVGAHPWLTAHAGCRFAVRSSGVEEDTPGHSFAGVHETFLHIDRERIADTVRACRRSGASDQATAYRAARGLEAPGTVSDRGVGVLIQPMVDAVVSGVAFTIHPVTGAHEVVVNAARGLGDDLVSGRITPDHYVISRRDSSLVPLGSSQVAGRARLTEPAASGMARGRGATEPVLSPDQLRELSALAVRVEAFFGSPQDVEWCLDAHQFWILQSRPITTGTSTAPLPDRVDVEWTRANMAEVFPDLMSPQATAAYEELLNRGQRLHMGKLLSPDAELGPPFRGFGGRLYFNLTQLKRIARMGGAPASSVLRSLGHADAITPADEAPVRLPVGAILRHFPDFVKLAVRDLRAPALVRQLDADNAKSIAELTAVDPRSLDDQALWRTIEHWREAGPERMIVVLVLGGVLFLEESIRKACRSIGQDYEAFVYPQLAAGEPSVSTAQAFDLVELAEIARGEPVTSRYLTTVRSTVGGSNGWPADSAGERPALADLQHALAGTRFLAAFDRFLERYGHRGHYESDWALPRYREDPSPLLFAIRTHVENPRVENRPAIAERLDREARRAWAAFDARLTWWQRLVLRPRVRSMVMRLKERYRLREYCRSELIRVLYHVRQWHLVMADRFVERGWIDRRDDYFLLHIGEIAAVVRAAAPAAGLRDLVATRTRERAVERGLSMPLLMRQSQVDAVLAGIRADDSARAPLDRREGLCVSRGLAEAEVVVILDPREFRLMKRGAILVAPATDPSWTPLFTLASGVIVEVGGILSHASTVAREYGLPALANVKDATTWLSTGDRVRLDASGGSVTRL